MKGESGRKLEGGVGGGGYRCLYTTCHMRDLSEGSSIVNFFYLSAGKTVNQRARRVSFPNSESSSLENPFQSSQALSQSLGQEKGRRQSLRQRAHIQSPDTAEIARGRHQIKLEGRQHSGMAFSKSSPDVRLGDSVQSLTMTEG